MFAFLELVLPFAPALIVKYPKDEFVTETVNQLVSLLDMVVWIVPQ